jgi:nucleoside-triphosphatase THEP1
MKDPKIIVVTGEIGSGKTSLCLNLIDLAIELGYSLSGLVSPGVFQDGKKVAIDLLDLVSRDQRRLAVLREDDETGLITHRWSFDPETILWGNSVLEESPPSDLLVIDELGPLEFNRTKGLIASFDLIDQGAFQAALLVIRPSLVQHASRRWEIRRLLDLSGSGPFPKSIENFLKSFDIQPEA